MLIKMERIPIIPINSMITDTTAGGRKLVVQMKSQIIKFTQPDEAIRIEQRELYANHPLILIQTGQVFTTIAFANNYRKEAKNG